MDAKVIWQNDLSFTGSTDSGVEVQIGKSKGHQSSGNHLGPMELVAIALASCTAMDVVSILHKKRQSITAFEVKVHTEQASGHPKVFTEAIVEYHVSGTNVEEAAVFRSIELSVKRYCPVQAMLSKSFPIRLKYYIYNEAESNQPTYHKSGECYID